MAIEVFGRSGPGPEYYSKVTSLHADATPVHRIVLPSSVLQPLFGDPAELELKPGPPVQNPASAYVAEYPIDWPERDRIANYVNELLYGPLILLGRKVDVE